MPKGMSLVGIAPPGPYLARHIIRERHMKFNAGLQSWRLLQLFQRVLLLAVAGCAQPALTSTVAIPPISPSEARIWIYRDYQPSESLNLAAVTINGASAGDAQPGGGAFHGAFFGLGLP
jgi:hypothetical protein